LRAKAINLEDGWLDGQGKKISPYVATNAQSIIRSDSWRQVDNPAAFPTQAGGILIEADKEGWLISIEISPIGRFEVSAFKPKDRFPPFVQTCDTSNEVDKVLQEILHF
jgi:hypothetical protein